MDVVVHSRNGCPYCVKAKDWLRGNGIAYEERVHDGFDARQRLYDAFGLEGDKRTVPQVVVDGLRIGGYADLIASDLPDRAGS